MSDSSDPTREGKKGFSRRGFLTSMGAGAVTVALPARLAGEPPPAAQVIQDGELSKVLLHINGREHAALVEPRWSLLHVLREELGLTAAKEGCSRGECGACTVLIDGVPRYSCLTLAVEAEGVEVTSLEGLMEGEELGHTQQAFAEEDAFQCGYCTPGQIMAAEGLIRADPDPGLDDIRTGVSGNLCRCGAYANIFRAVARAGELHRSEGGAS